MRLGASIFEKVLAAPPVTSDQLRLLEQDNICDRTPWRRTSDLCRSDTKKL